MIDSLAGKKLGDFLLKEVIERTPETTTYRAVQVSLDRQVAVKVFPDPDPDVEDSRHPFCQVRTLLGGLEHPNLVPVYSAWRGEGFCCIASRLLSGQNLRTLIQNGLSLGTGIRYCADICLALS